MIKATVFISSFIILCSMRASVSETDRHPGEALYKKHRCISCHGSKGTSPFNLTDSKMEFTYDTLRKYIDNPRAFGNQQMPAFEGRISETEYKSLIDYIIKLKNDAAKKK
jgi:mono/diheme cytochrome c family protein